MLNKPVAAETITEEAASSSPQEKDRQDETNDVRIESGKGKEEKKNKRNQKQERKKGNSTQTGYPYLQAHK